MELSMNRIQPALPAGAYQTYAITSPSDRTIVAACHQVGCEARAHGWETTVDEATELGRQQASYIRHHSRRTFREQRTTEGLTIFVFEPGQRCFREHRTRPERYFVRGGDWRPEGRTPGRQHATAADWLEDFGEHQQLVAEQIERG